MINNNKEDNIYTKDDNKQRKEFFAKCGLFLLSFILAVITVFVSNT